MSENTILVKYRTLRDAGCAGSLCDAFRDCYDEIAALEAKLEKIRQLVNTQAEDEGLWFFAASGPEAYLQQELRRLHALIEAAAQEEQSE